MKFVFAFLMVGLVVGKSFSDETLEMDYKYSQIAKASLQSDLKRIMEVVNLAYSRQPFNRVDRTRITIEEVERTIADSHNQLFLLIVDGQICGTVLLNKNEISLFAVHPSFQGQHLGQLLISLAEDEAFKKYDEVFLKVIPLFQERLIAYYESLGYHSYGEYETLLPCKLYRIQEQYHDQVCALVLRKNKN